MGKAVKAVTSTVTAPVKKLASGDIGGAVGGVTGGLTGAGLFGSAIGSEVGTQVGNTVKALGGGMPTAKAAEGEFAARAIKAEPFDISKQAGEAKARADEQLSKGESRQTSALGESSALRKQLKDIASGVGPSLATAQLKQAQDRTLAQQLAAASSQRGGNQAALQRTLARQQGAAGQELAQQAAVTGMQERGQAQQQLGAMLSQEQAAADQAVNNYLQLGFSIDQAQAAAQQDLERLRQGARAGQAALGTQASIANQQAQSQLLGGLLGGGATIGAALLSDKAQKKNVKNAKKDTADFLQALSAQKYDYKPESGEPSGKNYGIMAQDLEKSKMGKSLVMDTPLGKAVDVKKGFGAALASMAELNRRTSELEKAMRRAKVRKSKKES